MKYIGYMEKKEKCTYMNYGWNIIKGRFNGELRKVGEVNERPKED